MPIKKLTCPHAGDLTRQKLVFFEGKKRIKTQYCEVCLGSLLKELNVFPREASNGSGVLVRFLSNGRRRNIRIEGYKLFWGVHPYNESNNCWQVAKVAKDKGMKIMVSVYQDFWY